VRQLYGLVIGERGVRQVDRKALGQVTPHELRQVVHEGEAFVVDPTSELASVGGKLGGVEDPEAVLRLDRRKLLLETAPLVRMSEEAAHDDVRRGPMGVALVEVNRELHGRRGVGRI
jgi:hypothetical protein